MRSELKRIRNKLLAEADRKYIRKSEVLLCIAELEQIDFRQSKEHTIIEALLNVSSGMLLAWGINVLAWWLHPYIPGFTWELTFTGSVVMTIILTVVSVIRGVAWRRYFTNKFGGK